MVRIAVLEHPAASLADFVHLLRQAGGNALPASESAGLETWLAEQGIDVLVVSPPMAKEVAAVRNRKKSVRRNGEDQPWLLDTIQMKLTSPIGATIRLTHNECCILRQLTGEEGRVISRKLLVEAMGQNFLHYDERRLEAIISRLRRKLVAGLPKNQPEETLIRGIKGQGYLCGMTVREK